MKRILVTGGFGFIGTHLVERLLADPKNIVHVVDNLSTSPIDVRQYLRGLSYQGLIGGSDGVLRQGHVEGYVFTFDIKSVRDYFAQETLPHYDQIYHLASVVGPVGVLKHGGNILSEMVGDAYDIMNYCKRFGTRLVDISTSEVYGGGRNGYCCETDSMIVPPKPSARLEYAVAKLACEVALINQCNTAGLKASIIRPFNVAGPRQATAGGFVLPRFIKQVLANEPITVYGDGSAVRAFTDVRDIVDGIVRVMALGKNATVYNIGNPNNKTNILDLANRVQRAVTTTSQITFVNPKDLWGPAFEEASDKYPDASRAMEELQWQPKAGLNSIIADSIAYVRAARRD